MTITRFFFFIEKIINIYFFMILGWSTKNLIIIGLIALAILAIILVVLFLVFGKKFKKKSGSPQAATTTTTKVAVPKNTSADPKYQPVPNV